MTDTEGGAAVCVLGMSRSGTSLTTRVLNLAGVHLGPEKELLGSEVRQLADQGPAVIAKAREANPAGFWEHYRLMRLNERILRNLGGNWREPPPLADGWETSAKFRPLREEARRLLEESFSGEALWGWKDPRNSLTLPFWLRLVPTLRCVICLRNPLDVATSLERRDGIPTESGIRLWQRYVAASVANTSGRPRLFVRYEDHFEEPERVATRLARFVGREGALDGAGGSAALGDAIDEVLWRNRAGAENATALSALSSDAAALHRATDRLAAEPGEGECDGGAARAADELARELLAREPGKSQGQ